MMTKMAGCATNDTNLLMIFILCKGSWAKELLPFIFLICGSPPFLKFQ
jgi:hypothetical protein